MGVIVRPPIAPPDDAFSSSRASFTPRSVDRPKSASLPEVEPYTPILISPPAPPPASPDFLAHPAPATSASARHGTSERHTILDRDMPYPPLRACVKPPDASTRGKAGSSGMQAPPRS